MTISKSFFALSILAALTTSLPAGADIPPDDACVAAMVGKPCNNANGGESSQPGICGEAMCTRVTPDGPMTYACYRCEPSEPGAGGQPNEGGASGDTKSDADDDGGCSVTQARGSAGALGITLAVLGLGVARWRRRRSLRS